MLTFTEAQVLAWVTPILWPFLRVLAMFGSLPVLGQRTVPMRIRVALAFLIAFFSILSNGSVMGWTPPGDVPTWLVLVVLAIAYAAISSPFSALQRTSYATLSGRRTGGATDGLATLAIVLIVGVFAWTYSSEARAFIEQGYVVIRDFVTYWSSQG